MPTAIQSTVDRLDKPSAYYLGRVSVHIATCPSISGLAYIMLTKSYCYQNKKRKYDQDEREKTPEEQEDPLKDATTLYVGNL